MQPTGDKKTAASGMAWLMGQNLGTQLIGMIVSVILARTLEPEYYGLISITTIFTSICTAFVYSGLNVALLQKLDAEEVDYSSIFYISLAMATVMYAVLFFTAPFIAKFFGFDLLVPVLRVYGINLFISAFGLVQSSHIAKHYQFKKHFLSSITGSAVSGVVGVGLALSGFGVWALVAQNLLFNIVNRFVLFLTTPWRPKLMFSWQRSRPMVKFGSRMLVTSLVDTVYSKLQDGIIGKVYSPADLAFYTKGDSWPGMFFNTVSGPINNVLLPIMSDSQRMLDRMKLIMRRSVRTTSFLIFPVMMGLAVIGPTFIPLLLTDKWNASIVYMQIMCFVYLLRPIGNVNTIAIQALGRSEIILRLEITKKIIGCALLLISIRFGVFWMVVGVALSTAISMCITAIPNKKLVNYGLLEQLRDMLPIALLTVAMCVPVYALNLLNVSLMLRLVIQIATGILIYVGLSLLFRFEPFYYTLSVIKSMLTKKKQQVD